jgi:hypothetical protein
MLDELTSGILAPTAYPFLMRYLTQSPIVILTNELMKKVCSYYLERTLQEICYLNYDPSLVAAAAVYLALKNDSVTRACWGPGFRPDEAVNLLSSYTTYVGGHTPPPNSPQLTATLAAARSPTCTRSPGGYPST